MTTRDLTEGLASLFGLRGDDVGYAGLKDKHARALQTVSLYLPDPATDLSEVGARIEGALPVQVDQVRRHGNKLKTGHLRGNRFSVRLTGVGPGALEPARAIAEALERTGVPNYFGPQRQGTDGGNAARGRALLTAGGPRKKWLRRLLMSAWQSELFDRWLSRRMDDGSFEGMLAGDVAKKLDTGGLFDVEDPATDTARLAAREITFTGPMFGARMRWPAGGAPLALEQAVLEEDAVTDAMLRKARLPGSRRAGRVHPEELTVAQDDEDTLALSFALPKGSYATTVLALFQGTGAVE